MRIEWAIPCRYAEVNGGLPTIVGAGQEVIFASLPAVCQLYVAIQLLAAPEEFNDPRDHRLVIDVLDPEGAAAAEPLEARFAPRLDADVSAEWLVPLAVVKLVQWVANRAGVYRFRVQVDDAEEVVVPVRVKSLESAPRRPT